VGTNDIVTTAFRPSVFREIVDDIKEAYLGDSRPWVVGYSGGKDSTALLQLVYAALLQLPSESLSKHVYVLASDTRVETPKISARVVTELETLRQAAQRDGLPLSAHIVYPKLNDTFWVNIIGRGYPSPTNRFRWCTDRLKIYPISEFIQRVVSESGEVVIVLGGRKAESSTRAQTMRRHVVQGNRFRPHTQLDKAWVYTPIEDLTTNEVWLYLLQARCPWDGDSKGLMRLYKQAAGGECPLVIDQSTPSCGQSRFGCWTCTVVERDKSMQAIVDSGEDHLEPLLLLREYLQTVRDEVGARYDRRRNGSIPTRRGSDEVMSNTGPFTHNTRLGILRRVLLAQQASGLTLIEGDELAAIQEIWNREENLHPDKPLIPTDAVARVWRHVYEEGEMPSVSNEYDYLSTEDRLLREICIQQGVEFEMMLKLRDVEEEYGHLKRRHGLPDEMREIVSQYTERQIMTEDS
jgi:DNA sulfur modification protein DndC